MRRSSYMVDASDEPAFRGKNGTVVIAPSALRSRLASRYDASTVVTVRRCGGGRQRTSSALLTDAEGLRRMGLDETVALKIVASHEGALDEAVVHARLRSIFSKARKMAACALHPRICSASVAWRGHPPSVGEHPLLPMRRLAADRLPATADGLASMTLDVLEALAVLHADGLVHMDVKPDNILWDASHGRYVLSDYDLVSHVDDVREELRSIDGASLRVGTPGYHSPTLLGRLDAGYADLCRAAETPLDERAWAARFASVRQRAVQSGLAARTLLPLCDLHSLAMTLYRIGGRAAPAGLLAWLLTTTTLAGARGRFSRSTGRAPTGR